MKTITDFLKESHKKLKAGGISTARLDALILLEDEFGRDRAWILAQPDEEITTEQVKRLDKKIVRRANHEPLAYIRGFTEFYGRQFKVNKHVLEPRPESETMIELLKQLVNSKQLTVNSKMADVGTGSGALGITAALELPNVQVDLYDIDASALAVARHNCHMHELHLHYYKRNLLNRPARAYDILLANLPYVPSSWRINKAAAMEPKIAIFGGRDGLDVYKRLFEQLQKLPRRVQHVFTESLPPQHVKMGKIAGQAGYNLLKTKDFIQLFSRSDLV